MSFQPRHTNHTAPACRLPHHSLMNEDIEFILGATPPFCGLARFSGFQLCDDRCGGPAEERDNFEPGIQPVPGGSYRFCANLQMVDLTVPLTVPCRDSRTPASSCVFAPFDTPFHAICSHACFPRALAFAPSPHTRRPAKLLEIARNCSHAYLIIPFCSRPH